MNATRAAIAAGFTAARASVTGSELVRNRKVIAIIDQLQSKRASKIGVSAERVLEELSRLASSNILDYVTIDANGQPNTDFSKLTRDQAAAVQEIRVDTTGGSGDGERRQVLRTTFKLADKGLALERIGRHLKLFTDVVKHEGLETLRDALMEKE